MSTRALVAAPPAQHAREISRCLGGTERTSTELALPQLSSRALLVGLSEYENWSAHQAIKRLIEHAELYPNGQRWSAADSLFDNEERDA